MAEMLVKGTVLAVFAILFVIFVINFDLQARGQETISKYLRAHPGWFFIPVGALVGLLFGLAIHLFWTNADS